MGQRAENTQDPDYKLDFQGDKPLYLQVKDLIKNRVERNIWKRDNIIPSENELSTSLGVSVGTVKKALSDLVKEGVLYRRQGRGTFVAPPDFKRSFIRFFRYGLSDDQGYKIPSSRVLESEITKPDEMVLKALNLSHEDNVIRIKRIRNHLDLPLMVEDLYLPQNLFQGFEDVDISQELLYPIYDEKFAIPIIWAEEFLTPEIADSNIASFLEIEVGDPVIAIERIAYSKGDKPVEFRSSIGRGDRFQYHIEIR